MVITKMIIQMQHGLEGISIGQNGGWQIFQYINLVSPITMHCLRNKKSFNLRYVPVSLINETCFRFKFGNIY